MVFVVFRPAFSGLCVFIERHCIPMHFQCDSNSIRNCIVHALFI